MAKVEMADEEVIRLRGFIVRHLKGILIPLRKITRCAKKIASAIFSA